jgi:hypothetical protein
MLLDSDGRSVRRAIGFLRTFVRVTESAHSPDSMDLCGSEQTLADEVEPLETCDFPAAE